MGVHIHPIGNYYSNILFCIELAVTTRTFYFLLVLCWKLRTALFWALVYLCVYICLSQNILQQQGHENAI